MSSNKSSRTAAAYFGLKRHEKQATEGTLSTADSGGQAQRMAIKVEAEQATKDRPPGSQSTHDQRSTIADIDATLDIQMNMREGWANTVYIIKLNCERDAMLDRLRVSR
jgi:hypothetical protein